MFVHLKRGKFYSYESMIVNHMFVHLKRGKFYSYESMIVNLIKMYFWTIKDSSQLLNLISKNMFTIKPVCH